MRLKFGAMESMGMGATSRIAVDRAVRAGWVGTVEVENKVCVFTVGPAMEIVGAFMSCSSPCLAPERIDTIAFKFSSGRESAVVSEGGE